MSLKSVIIYQTHYQNLEKLNIYFFFRKSKDVLAGPHNFKGVDERLRLGHKFGGKSGFRSGLAG